MHARFRNAAPDPAGRRRAMHGFTLIELMMVVVAIGILAMIAVPSYEYATIKARRSAAQGCLTEQAQALERYYTLKMTYKDATVQACEASIADHYDIAFVGVPDSGYTLQIAPKGRQRTADTVCGTMTIDHTGRKTGATGECWK
jgi:type IV pilus assembly protein PilE